MIKHPRLISAIGWSLVAGILILDVLRLPVDLLEYIFDRMQGKLRVARYDLLEWVLSQLQEAAR